MALVLSSIIILIIIAMAIMGLALIGYVKTAFALVIILLIVVILFTLNYLVEFYNVIFKDNAPYVRSSQKLIEVVLKKIEFKPNAAVYELGCGDAKFLRALVEAHDVKAIGYEYSFVPYLFAKAFNFFSKKKVILRRADFFKADLSEADYVFCYLLTKEMNLLEEKLIKELKPGALVISNTFKFKNWLPEQVLMADTKNINTLSNTIYIYKKH